MLNDLYEETAMIQEISEARALIDISDKELLESLISKDIEKMQAALTTSAKAYRNMAAVMDTVARFKTGEKNVASH